MIRRVIVALAGAAVLTGGSVLLLAQRQIDGQWPFRALERREQQIRMADGGVVSVVGLEDRGWLSDGFVWSASYDAPTQGPPEVFAQWAGHDGTVIATEDGDALVCLTPDRQRVHLRTGDAAWKMLELAVQPGVSADGTNQQDRLPPRDQRRVLEVVGSLSPGSAVTSDIRAYDPARHELVVALGGPTPHDMVVRLDPVAATLTLVDVRRRP